ncbi:MAG: hypothetical protein S4CHLAM81_14190 [Chlamydiales bacterium]|nr:hypothetical protein [Chlamydiales bacterium]MCH9636191.1 hypothetical protein [Chlamydiales bacterium]
MASISSKIFVGAKMTLELRPLLQQLTAVEYEGREYLGRYVESASPTLAEVEAICHELASIFAAHREEVPSRAPQIVAFGQLFVG